MDDPFEQYGFGRNQAPSDPLTAFLDRIRKSDTAGIKGHPWIESVPRLLAAVDAVLKMTAGSGEPDLDWDGNPEHCMIRVVRCDEIRAAIERELTRKDNDDE